jgi:Mrp family chromosome partitioning ATPase
MANHPRLSASGGAQDRSAATREDSEESPKLVVVEDDAALPGLTVDKQDSTTQAEPTTQAERILFKSFWLKYPDVDVRLPAVRRGDETATGAYRSLAVRVSNIVTERNLKTIIITSAREGEGKTTVAANLAASIAHLTTERVLLIDADLRRPRLGERLGILPRFGWGDLLQGLASPINSIVRTEPGGLHVLVNKSLCQLRGSSASAETVDLLASHRPEELLEELKHQFELIVVDCPCITEYAEAQKLALIADSTIMVVRAGYTHHGAVTDALKLVPKERRLGIVLNDWEV